MYYVRLPTGDEKTYRTVEEMVWDVELGVITREAMIFHPATKVWVQVTRHPQLGTRFVAEEGATEDISLDFDLLSEDEIKGMAPPGKNAPAAPTPDLVINTDIAVDAAEQLAAAPEVEPAEGLAIAGEFLTLKEPIPSLLTPEPPAPRPLRPPRPPPAHRFHPPPPTSPIRRPWMVSWRRFPMTACRLPTTSRSIGSRSHGSGGWQSLVAQWPSFSL